MSKSVITAEGLGKSYMIAHQKKESYSTFRDLLTNFPRQCWVKLSNHKHQTHLKSEEFWALNNVNFEISSGDRVGIIGRNGAGKSTLLKILSRITEPTTGKIEITGRVASLLEVGTGFHPELTGRENIFLNGAILGMGRAEIKNKFDEIVSFAEVEKFLDTPVKRYSSGMYIRLSFAVAAHLDPEILIIDEVLAVGDIQFQKKCLGKMEDVSTKEGRTVLFVSHQMGTIANFCNKAFLLDHGKIIQNGPVSHVVNCYMTMAQKNTEYYKSEENSRHKDIAIIKASSFDLSGNPVVIFTHNQEIVLLITCKVNNWIKGAEVRVSVRDSKRNVFTTDTELVAKNGEIPEELYAKVIIPRGVLRPEQYFFKLATYLPNQIIFDHVDDALSITVIDGGSKYAASDGLDYGCVFVNCQWSIHHPQKQPKNT